MDAQEADDAAKLLIQCEHIISFLWANVAVPTVELVEPAHPQADAFYDECLQIIQPPAQPPAQQPAPPQQLINQQAEMNQNVHRLVEFLEVDRQHARAKENQSKFESWRSKAWYLRAATTDGDTPATEPTVGIQKILDESSAAAATFEVRKILSMNYNTKFEVPITLISKS